MSNIKFQVINENGVVAMSCTDKSCIPSVDLLKDMYGAGYRFKIDGKSATIKRVKEVLDKDE